MNLKFNLPRTSKMREWLRSSPEKKNQHLDHYSSYVRAVSTSLCVGAIAFASFGQYDFSSATGWSRVDVEYPGPGPLPPVNSPTNRIDINNGKLNFIAAPDGPNDIRYYREVLPMCDNWVAEFDFEATNGNPASHEQLAYFPFVLTEEKTNPAAITNKVNWVNTTTYTDNNAIGAFVSGTYDANSGNYSLWISAFTKLGTTTSSTWLNPSNSDRIDIDLGVEYHVTVERLDLSHGKITVENSSGFFESYCFDIDPAITGLKHVQASNNPVGGAHRQITGWVDNIDIMNCITRENCCSSAEIMGLSQICLPSTSSAFYAVNNGANNYTWSVTGGATIVSGAGTNMIQVDFTGATGPVTVSATIDCGCTQTVLSKAISCSSSMMLDETSSTTNAMSNQKSLLNVLSQDGDVEVYPNPSEGVFSLEGVDADAYSVINTAGEVIQESQTLNSNSIDLTNEKDGTYLLIITNGKDRRVIKLMKSSK